MRPELLALALALPLASPVAAEGLEGRTVLFRVETWDDPAAPLLVSRDYVAAVGAGPEFDVAIQASGGLVVVPATIDLAASRLDLSFADLAPGAFAAAAFNGYVLTFPVECTLLTGAALDPAATTLPLTAADVAVEPQALRVNVAGRAYGPGDRIGLTLDVTDCPLS